MSDTTKHTICTIGVPMDFGQARRGVDMGPAALRYANLNDRLRRLGHEVEDWGNIEISVRDALPSEGGLAYLPEVARTCRRVYDGGQRAVSKGQIPLFLGGDHSIAVGTVGGVTHSEPCGLLWVDAHGDFNTPATSPSGNIHGMPLAALLGFGPTELTDLGRPGPKLESSDVILLGLRDLDPGERERIRDTRVGAYTMREIDERGMAAVANEALARLGHRARLHLSLDMDALDPSVAPGVGTPVPGGLSYREAHLLMEIVAESERLSSVDVVEINPILDHRNTTATLARELVVSAFGKTIL